MKRRNAQDIADFLIALSQKGETAHEVAALATVMKSYAVQLDVPRRHLYG